MHTERCTRPHTAADAHAPAAARTRLRLHKMEQKTAREYAEPLLARTGKETENNAGTQTMTDVTRCSTSRRVVSMTARLELCGASTLLRTALPHEKMLMHFYGRNALYAACDQVAQWSSHDWSPTSPFKWLNVCMA
eukprot:1541200-Pleurochrysis_carterae.AAC.8